MRIIIYCRVSSKGQLDGTSLKTQEEACRYYCEQNGWEIVKVFIEEGESAKTKDRRALLEAIDFCQKNNIDIFVTHKVDRFFRNVSEHHTVKSLLSKNGTSLRSATEGIDDSPTGQLMENMLASIAQFDNDLRTTRVVGGMIARLEGGIWPWVPPFGYLSPVVDKKEKKTKPDKINYKIFPIIQSAFKKFLTGTWKNVDFMNYMNGYPEIIEEHGGKKLSEQFIDMMLSNKYYAGILISKISDKEYDGKHVSMITPEEYERIQLIRSGRAKIARPYSRNNEDYPLRGLIVCLKCGRKLTASAPKGNGGIYKKYHCQTKGCCPSIPADEMHRKFRRTMERIVPTDKTTKAFGEVVTKQYEEKFEKVNNQRKKVEKDILKIEEDKKKAIISCINKEITPEEKVITLTEYDNRIGMLRLNRNDFEIEEYDIETNVNFTKFFFKNAWNLWKNAELSQKQRIQSIIFPEGLTWRDNNFGTIDLALVYRVSDDISNQKPLQIGPTGLEPVTSTL